MNNERGTSVDLKLWGKWGVIGAAPVQNCKWKGKWVGNWMCPVVKLGVAAKIDV